MTTPSAKGVKPDWTPLSKTHHAGRHWQKYADFSFTQSQSAVPVVMAELAHLLPWYALALVPKDEAYELVALLALKPDQNAYVSPKGKWKVAYTPSYLRSYPFSMQPVDENAKQFMLCVDQASDLILDEPNSHSWPLFDQSGDAVEFSAEVQNMIRFLSRFQKNKLMTDKLIQQLDEVGVITPWSIEYSPLDDPDNVETVSGFFRIDPDKLLQLQAIDYLNLAQSGALELAFAQKFSQERLNDLVKIQAHSDMQSQSKLETLDLNKLFGEEEDGSLKF